MTVYTLLTIKTYSALNSNTLNTTFSLQEDIYTTNALKILPLKLMFTRHLVHAKRRNLICILCSVSRCRCAHSTNCAFGLVPISPFTDEKHLGTGNLGMVREGAIKSIL